MNSTLYKTIVALLLCLATGRVNADPVLYALALNNSNLDTAIYQVDPTTGVATSIISSSSFSAISSPFASTAMTTTPDGNILIEEILTARLFDINQSSGAITPGATYSNFNLLSGIAYNSSDTLFGFDDQNNSLQSIDPLTGSATLVGSPALGSAHAAGLDFSTSDELFMLTSDEQVLQLDPSDGSILNTVVLPDPGGSGYQGIAFDTNDTLYVGQFGVDLLHTVDPTDGTILNSVPVTGLAAGQSLVRLTFANPVQAVPEPTSFVLFGIGIAGFLAYRRFRVS